MKNILLNKYRNRFKSEARRLKSEANFTDINKKQYITDYIMSSNNDLSRIGECLIFAADHSSVSQSSWLKSYSKLAEDITKKSLSGTQLLSLMKYILSSVLPPAHYKEVASNYASSLIKLYGEFPALTLVQEAGYDYTYSDDPDSDNFAYKFITNAILNSRKLYAIYDISEYSMLSSGYSDTYSLALNTVISFYRDFFNSDLACIEDILLWIFNHIPMSRSRREFVVNSITSILTDRQLEEVFDILDKN